VEQRGTAGGHTDAAVIYDSEVQSTEMGVDCGATIQIWPYDVDATARTDYIQTTLKTNQALGTDRRP
jgi:hypothetical protein